MQKTILHIAEELLALPAVPFREEPVRRYIRRFCTSRGVAVREDDMGNLIAVYGRNYRNPVLAFGAHMDHPGFIIEKDSRRKRTTALFYGGIEEEYFRTAKVRVFTGTGDVLGRVRRTAFNRRKRIQRVWLTLDGSVKAGDTAMWDLTPFRVKSGRLYSRGCDDGVGCVSVLALFDELVRRRVRKKVLGVFTVAEEGGLNGAKYLALKRRIPRRATVIAIETSRELPVAPMGEGVVIRVGDRVRVFDPAVTRFMEQVARKLRRHSRHFRAQRALMDGGTCEASIYQASGYAVGAACVPLGNYHNRNFRTGRIAPEYVSVTDLVNMVRLFVGMVRRSGDLPKFAYERPPLYREERRALGERLFNAAGATGRRKP